MQRSGAEVNNELADVNPFDPATLQCPFPHYARMRSEAPVLRLPRLGAVVVTTHELAVRVLRDHTTFSSGFGAVSTPVDRSAREELLAVMAEGYPRLPTLLTVDPPAHTRYRGLVAQAFHPRAVAALEPVVRRIANELIDDWDLHTPLEFVERFAVPLPVRVIAHALNVPEERLADFKRWSDDSVAGIGSVLSVDERLRAERGVNEFQHYFAAELERRRSAPQDDLLTHLLNATLDEGVEDGTDGVLDRRPLDTAEILSIIQQLLVAGNETTTKALAEMMLLLGQHRHEWEQLRNDPTRIERVVEEVLRLATPVQGMWRLVTVDTELAGVTLAKGTRVLVVFASADRDESLFEDPNRFDPDRFGPGRLHQRDHLAFGRGIHFCLGANLARLELRVALEAFLRRLRSFTLTSSNEFAYFPSFLLRGLVRLEIDVVAEAP